jgi:hypothetical protein
MNSTRPISKISKVSKNKEVKLLPQIEARGIEYLKDAVDSGYNEASYYAREYGFDGIEDLLAVRTQLISKK